MKKRLVKKWYIHYLCTEYTKYDNYCAKRLDNLYYYVKDGLYAKIREIHKKIDRKWKQK